MLNTPQVSFAVTNGNQQTPSSQISLGAQQNWDHTLQHFDNEQKLTSMHSEHINAANTRTLGSADINSMVSRADTLDRIPVFVNPQTLNQTNHASLSHVNHGTRENAFNNPTSNFSEYSNTNQENTSQDISHQIQDSEQQSQIQIVNTSTPQVFFLFINPNWTGVFMPLNLRFENKFN